MRTLKAWRVPLHVVACTKFSKTWLAWACFSSSFSPMVQELCGTVVWRGPRATIKCCKGVTPAKEGVDR